MNILSCDTSTLLGSVAVANDKGVLASRSLQRAGSHSDTLNIMIQECLADAKLKLSDIDLFASGLGPGSFTGIRISLNTLKTFGYVYQKPCVGFNSLATLAWPVLSQSESVVVMINAFKNMVYFAEYAASVTAPYGFTALQEPQVVRVQELAHHIKPGSVVVGDGYLAYQEYIQNKLGIRVNRLEKAEDFPLANALCHILSNKSQIDFASEKFHWSNLIPVYLRASEAEENLQGIKYLPL